MLGCDKDARRGCRRTAGVFLRTGICPAVLCALRFLIVVPAAQRAL